MMIALALFKNFVYQKKWLDSQKENKNNNKTDNGVFYDKLWGFLPSLIFSL